MPSLIQWLTVRQCSSCWLVPLPNEWNYWEPTCGRMFNYHTNHQSTKKRTHTHIHQLYNIKYYYIQSQFTHLWKTWCFRWRFFPVRVSKHPFPRTSQEGPSRAVFRPAACRRSSCPAVWACPKACDEHQGPRSASYTSKGIVFLTGKLKISGI